MSNARAFYLRPEDEPILVLHHPAANPRQGTTGIVVCSPWGWDEVASYRSRREWAHGLAAAGHPVARFDLPGVGDSAGGPATPGLLDRWVDSIGLVATWLRGEGGAAQIALLGIGLGGLLAEEALARGLAVEELVCWGAPATGRHFTRELKTFAALQGTRPAERPDGPKALLDGWLEAGGFMLSGETLAALKGLNPAGAPLSRRALLLGRDGIADNAGAARLRSLGVEVSEDPGLGWGGFVGHPETTQLPGGVEQVVRGWLARAGNARDADGDDTPPTIHAGPRASFGSAGHSFTEEPVRVSAEFGDAFGVLAQPDGVGVAPYCTVFLNAGAIRHIGPNRLWTESARNLAAAGLPSLRVDLESIGEADGDQSRRASVAAFYDTGFVAQVVKVLDWLEEIGLSSSFRLVGLCAGGYWAFRAGLVDDRVESMALLNAGALAWHPGILEERDGRRFGRVLKRRWWGMLLRREISPASALRLVRLAPAGIALSVRRLRGRERRRGGAAIAEDLDRMPADRRLVLAFSGSEPLREELGALGITDRLGDWPILELVDLPGADHTLRSAPAQRAVAELLEAERERQPRGVGQAGTQK
jgi:pimeloyl-ACP methyl ester carboxylesterase